MEAKSITYPQYRKYSNNKAFFKIISPDKFEEIQVLGDKISLHIFEAKILPDRNYIADLTFNFSITYRSPALTGNHYSEYQLFLYQTISEHREQGLTFDAIAKWLTKEGCLTVRGKRFRGTHVHSILKKRLAKEELLNQEHPPV